MARGLLVERDDGTAIVTLDRPRLRNALDRRLIDALAVALTRLDHDDAVHAIVLTGTDPAFCSGIDLKEAARRTVARPDQGHPVPMLSKPLIAAVNGAAVTGGLELVLACDFGLASERASFADTHGRFGSLPFWGLSVRLPAAIGVRRACQLSLTGDPIDAPTALAWGLVNEVVPHDELLPRALEVARSIARSRPDARRLLLATYRAGQGESDRLLWERLMAQLWHDRVLSPDHWGSAGGE